MVVAIGISPKCGVESNFSGSIKPAVYTFLVTNVTKAKLEILLKRCLEKYT